MDITILGIESSCDDTSAAVIRGTTLLSNVIASQAVHIKYGGVIPELASRAHQQNIIPVVDTALKEAGVTPDKIDAIAFTRGPGLLGSLLVGTSFAKGLSIAHNIPMVEVNHLQGHILSHLIVLIRRQCFAQSEDKILNVGIQNLSDNDVKYAREKDFKIKLVPTARKISTRQVISFVLPKFVKSDDFIYNVENEYNCVTVQAAFADKQFFFGKGAGGHPTGAAVLSDIAALRYDYKYEYKKYQQQNDLVYTDNVSLEVYLRYEHEYTLDKLKVENIKERFANNDFKYVIGNVSLKNLLANRDLLQHKDVFIAHTGKYTYTEQQLKTVSEEATAALN